MMHRLLAMVVVLTLVAGALSQAPAQGIPFGGIRHDSSQPVEITADSLSVDQEARTAEFNGSVAAGQGSLRLTADRLVVEYQGEGSGEIRLMRAYGNVTMTNGGEAAEAEEAIYTVVDGMMRMMGNVLLTQGENAIAGDIANINLDTGTAVFEGRVTSVFKSAEDG